MPLFMDAMAAPNGMPTEGSSTSSSKRDSRALLRSASHRPPLWCHLESQRIWRGEGSAFRSRIPLPPGSQQSRFHMKEGNFGGVGKLHPTPCGAAVPARPPTHRDYILEVDSGPLNGPMAPPQRVRSS